MYPVCGNPDCVCAKRIPKGNLPMINDEEKDTETCPYCGYSNHIEYWDNRSLQQALKIDCKVDQEQNVSVYLTLAAK